MLIYAKEYEDYLITGKEECLNTLIPGGIEYEYIKLIRSILSENLTENLKQKIKDFVKRYPNNQTNKLKALLYMKELESNPENLEEIIKSIKQLFNLPYVENVPKPRNYNREIDDLDDNESHESNKINDNELLKYEQLLNDIYNEKIDPNNNKFEIPDYSENVVYPFNFNKIPDKVFYKMLTDYHYSNLSQLFYKQVSTFDLECFKNKFDKFLKSLKESKNKTEIDTFKSELISQSNNLNNEQLNYLISLNNPFINKDNLIGVLLYRKYPNIEESKEEKKKILLEINDLLNKMNYKYEQYKRNVLYTILKNDMEMNIYDLEKFMEYIELPSCNSDSIKTILKIPKNLIEQLKVNKTNSNNIQYFQNVERSQFDSEKKLITNYLTHFFRFDNIPMVKFQNNILDQFLKKIYYTTKFLNGDEEVTKTNNLSLNEINDLMNKIILEICPHNKEKFLIDEDIILDLDIKNIQTLFVKIYEINTENYYYNHQSENFDNTISVEGILPTFEEIYNYSDKPQILNRKKITLSKIPKKRGIYIIEFIGNGHVSRAVIICKGENTGIWLNNIFYPSKEDGSILIPFSNNAGNKFIIYKHNDFCEVSYINILRENYSLKGIFIIEKESFIMGNLVKCLVRPILSINNEICDINFLKKVVINVNCKKIENNQEIPVNFKFDNVNLSYEKDYEFEFQIPSKVKSIDLILTGEITKKSNEEKINLSISRSLNLHRNEESDHLFKVINGEYIGEIVGKNGEPRIYNQMSANILCKYQRENNQILESDVNGKINLGKLPNVNSVIINKRPLYINLENNYYQNNIIMIKDEEIKIPIHEKDLFILIKNDKSEDYSNKIKKEITDKENGFAYLIISNLPYGEYTLYLNNKQIYLNVLEGKMINDDFIITKKFISNISKAKQGIFLEKVLYKDKKLYIKVNSNLKNNPRIHINATQYFPEKGDEFLSEYSKILGNTENNSTYFPIKNIKNQYLNNSILNEEIQYVLDRKQYEKKMGNLLEKPSLLLKPQFTKDTKTSVTKPREGRDFDRMNDECYRCSKAAGARRGYCPPEPLIYDLNMIKVRDFIDVSPLNLYNIIPNEKGEIILENDLSDYGNLHIICIDDNGACEEYISLNNDKSTKRDLRMVNKLNLEKNYCELRKVHCLNKGDKYKIMDITSVNYKIFDSIEKYANFLKLVNPNIKNDLEQFEFLFNFDNLNQKEKLDKVSEYFSHELNIYLYFHYNKFFNEFICPIIKFKSEKTFIDYFLLNDKENINKYVSGDLFNKLNNFEKCLLIYSIREENRILAKNISRLLRSQVEKENIKEMKKYFNTALNLKTEEERQIEDEIHERERNLSFKKAKNKRVLASRPQANLMKMNMKMNMMSMPDSYANEAIIKANLNKEIGKTKEYCETHYYNQAFKNNNYNNIISNNHFFADLAEFFANNINSNRNEGFKSENILLNPINFTQTIFILSVLDLQNKTQSQSQKYIKDEGLGLTIESNTNCYILTKELSETKLKENSKNSLILAQITSAYDKNKNEDEDEEPEKYLINKTYIQKTIVTNISNKPINCEILIQIPEGSLPIDSLEYTIIENIYVDKFKSVILSQKFYFPHEGKFKCFPSTASFDDLVIAKGKIKEFDVVKSQKLEKDKIKSIDDVLEQGNKKEILNFIQNCTFIKRNDIQKILYLLSDKDFFENLIKILESKFYYDDNVWKYSLIHKNIPVLKTYIMNQNRKNIFNDLGNKLNLQFFETNKTNNAHIINHKDYYPILNSRVFKLPKAENSILNLEFRKTYQNFISYLITLKEIDNESLMRFCYYLILQQRIDDAVKIYNKINKEEITKNKLSNLNLQYDYLTAYLDFSIGYPKFEKAKEILKKYENFPLSTWSDMFKEIKDQLNEYEGKENYDEIENMDIDEINYKNENKLKAKEEEDLSIEIKDKKISVLYKNINTITVKFYLIDVEILFSRNPFMNKSTVDFNYVSPSEIITYNLNKSSKEEIKDIQIPENLKNKDLYIEVSANKKKEYETYYSSLLKCSIIESIGEIKVLSPELKPLPKIYIKCFCEDNNGKIQFYKDGFTDLRGKFNYVSLNSDLINTVKQFSILVMSKDYGSLIKKCNPPKMIKGKNNESGYEQFKNYRQEMKNRYLNNKQNIFPTTPNMISSMLDYIDKK